MMGSTASMSSGNSIGSNSREIDYSLKEERKASENTVKLLLLGPGECGKSTILKQLRILHSNGFSEVELLFHRRIIRRNALSCIKMLINQMKQMSHELADSCYEDSISKVLQLDVDDENEVTVISDSIVSAIRRIWTDSGIQRCYAKAHEFQLHDCAAYFLNDIERICCDSYLPTDQDVLMSRQQTTSIVEYAFNIKKKLFRVVDVGGQRTSRRKWLNQFDCVDSVIFIAAIGDYNLCMREAAEMNRLVDSFQLFDFIVNSTFFYRKDVILFLNKIDLFAEKIKYTCLRVALPDYRDGQSYEPAYEFVKLKFQGTNTNSMRKIHCYATCATDTNQVQLILNSTFDIILAANAKKLGLV